MPNPLYLPELREMLATNDTSEMTEFLTALHPARTAEFMEGLNPDEIWEILKHAPMHPRVDIFGFFDEATQVAILEIADHDEIAEFIGNLPSDDRVDIMKEVEPEIFDKLMPLIDADERRDIQRLGAYEEETSGSEMTTAFARLYEGMTVEESLNDIARQAMGLETIYYLYVVDRQDHLRGLVSARKLIAAMVKPKTLIEDIMDVDLVTVHVQDDQEEMAQKVARYNLLAIPVVDDEYRLVGIITHDDVLDVLVEEMTEDAYRSAAVEPLEETYIETPLSILAWKRGIWLTVLFFCALLTAFALRDYEWITESAPWLVAFIPLIISTGGNSGSQSATLIITALSTNQIRRADWLRIAKRELSIGLMLGAFLGICGYLIALWMQPGNVIPESEMLPLETQIGMIGALVVPLTLVTVTIFGMLAGSMLPLLFSRIGWDPALMSNPSVAGLVDVVGIVIYMNIARWILEIPPLVSAAGG